MDTAQTTFRAMLRGQIAPALRQMGFKGSGQQFALASSTHWALLGFQRSAWSSREGVSFTVNLTVADRQRWADYVATNPKFRAQPGANWGIAPVTEEFFGDSYWHVRIGKLIPRKPHSLDHWWSLEAGEDTTALAAEVTEAIRLYALPALRKRIE